MLFLPLCFYILLLSFLNPQSLSRCYLRSRVAPTALTVCANGCDSEPVFCPARQTFYCSSGFCRNSLMLPRGVCWRVGANLYNIASCAAHSVPLQINLAVMVAHCWC